MSSPLTIEPIKDAASEHMDAKCCRMYRQGLVKVSPSNCIVPTAYRNFGERIKNFNVKPDDVFVVTFPKCGTTWTQEMVWLLANNVDLNRAKNELLFDRFPFIDYCCLIEREEEESFGLQFEDTVEECENLASPRCIKSHLPLELLPDQIWSANAKVVYVARGAKDAAVSYYHHHRLCNGYSGTLDEFLEVFINDRVHYAPFWKHILEFWKIRDRPNVLFLAFEDMKKDLRSVIQKVAHFLGKNLTDEQLDKLTDHLSFEKMRNNPMVNFEPVLDALHKLSGSDHPFMRKGQIGDGEKSMSPEMVARFDSWSRSQIAGTGYTGAL